ncbi:MAG: tail fiber domain-containing protein [Candidatus Babeliales bacterium]
MNRSLLLSALIITTPQIINAQNGTLEVHRRPKLTIIPRLAVYSFDAERAQINGPVTVNGPIKIEGTLTINGHPLNPSGLLELPLPISNGGTNATAMTNTDGVVYYDGTVLNTTAAGASNTVLLGNGTSAAPSFGTVPNAALTNSSITLTNGTGISITGGSPLSLGGSATITLSTPVSIAHGGTNATAMTNTNGVVYYDGTVLNTTAAGASNTVLLGNGTSAAPSFGTVPNAALTNSSITLTNGTGISITGGSPLSLGGSATIALSTPVTVANGGTGAGTFTVNGVLLGNGTSAITATAVGTAGQLLTSNGTGNAPTFQAAPASSITITTDSGSVSGNSLTLTAPLGSGNVAGSGSSVQFTGSGTTITLAMTDGNGNTLVGAGAGNASITGNTNVAFGQNALPKVTTGRNNCAIGQDALSGLVSGANNIAIGQGAGSALSGAEQNNIYIGSSGSSGDNGVININPAALSATIGGIANTTISGSPVLVSSGGNLGIASSSRNYKKNIQDIDPQTTKLLELRPVTFNYKKENMADELHFGLIAEEVEELIPDLVIRDKNGDVQTVKYHELPALLLAHIKQLAAKNAALEARIAVLEGNSSVA